METYPVWDPDARYVKGDRIVHGSRLYVAAESVVATEPDPSSGFEHWPWVYLGWHSQNHVTSGPRKESVPSPSE